MSHYYGRLQGHRGEATRCGTKKSGVRVVARSWDIEARTDIKWSEAIQADIVHFIVEDATGHQTITANYAIVQGKLTLLDSNNMPELLV